MSRARVSSYALIAALVLTIFCYWPGISGGFLFDDIPNLRDLGAYGGVTDWETLKSFVLSGWSGPTGRPISLISFLLNDNNWPSEASRFKPTNLAIHLLCGLTITWASLLLLRFYGLAEDKAQWLAVFSATCWLLHPFLVSTTLYVIQRMSQLAALFVLAGIVGYLHGRSLLQKRPHAAYLWMGASLVTGTLLAVLSKENGALLPLLVGVIEFCAPTNDQGIRPARPFRLFFIWLPTIALLGYLATCINFAADAWPTRSFNQVERLLSEGRIIWDYLGNLLLPRIEGQGLYQDDFVISRDLATPRSTLPSLLALLTLLTAAIALRQQLPLFSLAVLFFLAGHLIESTVIGLELYFEHRNYLPTAFLFLPIASALNVLGRRIGRTVPVFIAILIISSLTFFTWSRANLWADSDKLELYWATSATNSPRAQNAIAAYYMNQGLFEEAQRYIEEASLRLPNSSLLTVRLLLQKIWAHQAILADFITAGQRLATQPLDAQAVMALRRLVEKVVEPNQPTLYRTASLQMLGSLRENATYNKFPLFLRLLPYLEAQIYLAENHPEQAFDQFTDAMTLYNDTDAALHMVAMMATSDHIDKALSLLDQAESLYRQQSDRTLKRSRTIYDQEIARLRNQLNDARSTP